MTCKLAAVAASCAAVVLATPVTLPLPGVSTPNVLFIAIDDLRPEHGVFGGQAVTPRVDAFARTAVTFNRNHVQIGVCSPSRTSLLTGLYPDTTHITDLWHYFRTYGANVTTLPQSFKDAGYYVAGGGKIFHPGHASGGDSGLYPDGGCPGCQGYNDPPSWTEYFLPPAAQQWPWNASYNTSWLALDGVPDDQHPDGQIAAWAVGALRKHAATNPGQPFFIAPGFMKPHLPFIFPSRFLDLYANYTELAPDADPAADEALLSWTAWGEINQYNDIAALIQRLNLTEKLKTPGNYMPVDKAVELRRAYFAATSFNDEVIGQVLDALEETGFAANTTVVIWGDHGWQLGDHGDFTKHTNYESVTRAPLLVRSPAYPASAGQMVTSAFTEHIDVFPTLLELTGVSFPGAAGLQGESLVPLLANPALPSLPKRGPAAYSQYPRHTTPCNGKDCSFAHAMGYTVRTDQWRYTEWVDYDNNTYVPNFNPHTSSVREVELYWHGGDAGYNWTSYENAQNGNVASQPQYADVVAQLSAVLHCSPGLLHPATPCPPIPTTV